MLVVSRNIDLFVNDCQPRRICHVAIRLLFQEPKRMLQAAIIVIDVLFVFLDDIRIDENERKTRVGYIAGWFLRFGCSVGPSRYSVILRRVIVVATILLSFY